MDDIKFRLQTAQWVFERNLAWIAAAEIKIGVVATLQLSMLGALAAAFSASEPAARTAWAYLFTLCAVGAALIVFGCAAGVIYPRTRGPRSSVLFFGRIAVEDTESFQRKFARLSDEEVLTDWTAQIHRNAEIATEKHIWVARAMGWSFVTALLWVCAVALLVKL